MAPTCPHFGFEADGGISAASWAGNAVTLTLNNSSASWLRLAHQVQNVSAMVSGTGGTYVEVDPNLQPSTSNAPSAPLTAVANGGGFVLITQSASAGAFSYLGGFSIRQVEV